MVAVPGFHRPRIPSSQTPGRGRRGDARASARDSRCRRRDRRPPAAIASTTRARSSAGNSPGHRSSNRRTRRGAPGRGRFQGKLRGRRPGTERRRPWAWRNGPRRPAPPGWHSRASGPSGLPTRESGRTERGPRPPRAGAPTCAGPIRPTPRASPLAPTRVPANRARRGAAGPQTCSRGSRTPPGTTTRSPTSALARRLSPRRSRRGFPP
jgi:hypothetical protein